MAMELSTSLMNHVIGGEDEDNLVKKNFNLDVDTKILLLYYTAWGTDEGMRYRPDVYGLDKEVFKLVNRRL